MSELGEKEGQSLLLLGARDQFVPDLRHIASAINFAKLSGNNVALKQLWGNSHIGRQVVIRVAEGVDVQAGAMTEAAAMSVAEIEVDRYETLPDDLLTFRERTMRDRTHTMVPDASVETRILGFSDIILGLGGVAVIGGTNRALLSAASYYDDLRQIGR